MTDKVTPARRSLNMSRIRSRNTKPEVTVRKLLHSLGYRFRIHVAKLPGCPDIVMSRHKSVIQVHGCFWHQHRGCSDGRVPASRLEYWVEKLLKNVERDSQTEDSLRILGWRVVTVWECETKNIPKLTRRLQKLFKNI